MKKKLHVIEEKVKLTNDISVTCPNVAGDSAIYDSIVTADNNVTHDSDLNDNSLTSSERCHNDK